MKLPESWVEMTVGKVVADLQPGFAQKPGDDDEGMTPQIRTHNVSPEGKITLDGIKHVSASAKELGRYMLDRGDVVFNNTNSEEWVGKTAVFDQDGEYVFSNHMTRLRADKALVHQDYLAGYLHLLWSMGYSKTRAKRWVSQAGIESSALASFKLPLPTLSEQQRIVDVLRQVEALGKCRSDTHATIATLTLEYYAKLFGDVFSNDKAWATKKISQISDIVRGSSPRPQGDPRLFGGPVPRLMVSDLTRDGLWVDATTDSLTIEGAKSSRPMPAQSVVMAVSGAPGLTAILNHDACIHDGFVGLRDLHPDLLPEFVAFTLNLLRAKNDQQAVGAVFRNLTSDQVKAIPITLPPLILQKQFQSFLFQVKSIQQDIARSTELLQKLSASVCVDAFTGLLTTTWRDRHQVEVTAAAQRRDALLRERGAKLPSRPPEPSPLSTPSTETRLAARPWLLAELSEFQRLILDVFLAYPEQPLLAEVPEEFDRFRESDALVEKLAAFPPTSPNLLRRTLGQLAALGLIAKVAVPRADPNTGGRQYLTAFRPLRPGEQTRAADVAALRRALGLGSENEGAEAP
ncbi:MAG: restriction endonuclease subunit S [Pseudomonadota bacterium]|nr:restriction endonuclease subunit S [Pseudomonadota bacterium]MDP1904040.1 restriction endonuclease subunit S [Pseudomonadota bacterium]MDP2352112.1 restriction endonuclease subunit S [Pseudomonadota bacterium]